ncbi:MULTISPECIES: hypothetical protein [unclassified Paenibacillus]|uniref:hypothetical protein n=1 Tax=unclassified Paenibacillus TaxID=185978 RepID=UPI00363CA475
MQGNRTHQGQRITSTRTGASVSQQKPSVQPTVKPTTGKESNVKETQGNGSPAKKPQGNLMQGCLGCLGLLVFGVLAIVVIGYFVGGDKESNATTSTSSSVSTFANAGKNAVINENSGGALSAITKDKLDELTNYALSRNEEAIKRMMDRGEIISIPNGTTVTVISKSGGTAQVEVLTGDYAGMKLYTYVERLKTK